MSVRLCNSNAGPEGPILHFHIPKISAKMRPRSLAPGFISSMSAALSLAHQQKAQCFANQDRSSAK